MNSSRCSRTSNTGVVNRRPKIKHIRLKYKDYVELNVKPATFDTMHDISKISFYGGQSRSQVADEVIYYNFFIIQANN